ncbi:MAG TPA: GAF domain-containing protein, partial [Nannocystis exedens]|nr:GAF domain-containing protein [Nannocystis exedens]
PTVLSVPGYDIDGVVHAGYDVIVHRARRVADASPVLLKCSQSERPSRRVLSRLRREASILATLDDDRITRILGTVESNHGFTLILEDRGGETLRHHCDLAPVSTQEFFDLAIVITDALATLHRNGFSHRNLLPESILITSAPAGAASPAALTASLTGLGAAQALIKGGARASTAAPLSYTYIAPEQTGRLNRPVDQRSDLYVLGLVFFELLTGRAPFIDDNSIGLAHLHIADAPPLPTSLQPTIPRALEAILLKLLAKIADQRYQSADALLHDLEHCRKLVATEPTRRFPLGESDPPPHLSFAERLYGSEGLIHEFLAASERVGKGSRELVLIGGATGAGKSQLIQELLHSHLKTRAQILFGRCPSEPASPYAPLLSAIRARLTEILSADKSERTRWRTQLQAALGDGVTILGVFLPELCTLLGEQSLPLSTRGDEREANQRFQSLFDSLLQTLAAAPVPFVVVIDDLQWIDASSAAALVRFFEDPRGHALLVVAAYRHNSDNPNLPAQQLAQAVANSGATVTEGVLEPLTAGDTITLLRDCLTPAEGSLRALAEHTFERTGGSPFLTRILLETMHDRGQIHYNRQSKHWSFELADHEPAIDLLAVMTEHLQHIPKATRETLAVAACIGLRFSLDLLVTLTSEYTGSLAERLAPALACGVLHSANDPGSDTLTYAFPHYRLYETMLDSLPASNRRSLHRRISAELLRAGAQHDERIFSVVAHIARGLEDDADPLSLANFARHSYTAGMRAMAAGAFKSAADYLATCVEMMPKSAWQDEHQLMLKLHMGLADARLLVNDFAAANALFKHTLEQIQSPLSRVDLLTFKLSREIGLRRFTDALITGRAGLRLLGIKLPAKGSRTALAVELARLRWQLGKRSPRCFLEIPESTEERTYLIHNLLMYMAPAALFLDFQLAAVIFLRLTNLTLQHGRTKISPFGISGYGLVLTTLHDNYEDALEVSEVADALLALHPSPAISPKVDLINGIFVYPWTRSFRDARTLIERSYKGAMQRGDLLYASFCATQIAPFSFLAGDNLSHVQEQASIDLAHIRNTGPTEAPNSLGALEMLCRSLRGQNDSPTQIAKTPEKEAAMLSAASRAPHATNTLYIPLYKGIALFHAGEYSEAQLHFDAAGKVVIPMLEIATRVDLHFFAALNLAELAMQAPAKERRRLLARLGKHHAQLQTWAKTSAEIFGARTEIVAGALALAEGRTHEVLPHLNAAITLASKADDPHRAGIAAELAARTAIASKTTFLLEQYLELAYDAYQRYGALAKLSALRANYGERQAASDSQTLSPDSSTLVPGEGSSKSLDVGTVIKATQALSGEIVLDCLLDALVQVVMENAGARRCFLVLVHEGKLLVEAEGSVGSESVEILRSTPLEERDELPQSIIKYVIRSGSCVVLDNAAQRGAFTKDLYVCRESLKSVLCIPIIHHNRVMGALYLENNLATDVFTGDRLELLNQ